MYHIPQLHLICFHSFGLILLKFNVVIRKHIPVDTKLMTRMTDTEINHTCPALCMCIHYKHTYLNSDCFCKEVLYMAYKLHLIYERNTTRMTMMSKQHSISADTINVVIPRFI